MVQKGREGDKGVPENIYVTSKVFINNLLTDIPKIFGQKGEKEKKKIRPIVEDTDNIERKKKNDEEFR